MTPTDGPIPSSVQSLCELFSTELSEVKFPDVDGLALREATERVVVQAEALARAEALLVYAREQLQEAQDALLHKSQRALSYALVFAEENPALASKLSEISLPRSPRRVRSEAPVSEELAAAPKRRGRPPKVRSDDPGLFQQEPVAMVAAEG